MNDVHPPLKNLLTTQRAYQGDIVLTRFSTPEQHSSTATELVNGLEMTD
jgi:nicotinamidase-related amidase